MKSLRLLLLLSAAAVIGAGAQTAAAGVHHHHSCLSVNATAIGQDLGHGRTTSTIVHAGILDGTTTGQLHAIGEASHHVLTVAGTGMLTANNGTLTLSVQGTINQATGAIDVSGHVVGGTGLFAHATGQLMFVGVEDLTNGSFANTITGTVCLAHR